MLERNRAPFEEEEDVGGVEGGGIGVSERCCGRQCVCLT